MIGQTLGHYRIVEKIGAGGMGEVYRAHDEQLERDVALKVLPAGMLTDEAARKRFRKEALALAKLNHPNIETVYEFASENGVDFLAMELIAGVTLSEKLNGGPLTNQDVLNLGTQIAEGLNAAHGKGVVHCDLKPGNVMVMPNGHAKVLDFGLAKFFHISKDSLSTESLTETQAAGTLPYMSPEQVRGERVDARTDIYGAGAVLYEMTTGQRPFPETQTPRLIDAILHQEPNPPSAINRRVTPGLDSVVLKSLDKNPERRYQSARELAVDLGRLSSPALPITSARLGKRNRIWLFVATAAMLIAILALAIFSKRHLWVRHQAQPIAHPSGPNVSGGKRLAILPLEVEGDGASLNYIADGLVESLQIRLSQLSGLNVAPEGASVRVEPGTLPDKVARLLGVNLVLRGVVRGAPERLQFVLNLQNVADVQPYWTKEFSGKTRDLLALEDEVYEQALAALAVRESEDERFRALMRPVVLDSAYELYLKGREVMSGRQGVPDPEEAIHFYEQALKKDKDFGLAYVGLSDASLLMYREKKDSSWAQKAAAAAQRAQHLNDSLPEVHFALGNVYTDTGKTAEAVAQLQRALQLVPNSDEGYRRLGAAYLAADQKDKAIQAFQKAIEINPYYWVNQNALGAAYFQLGQTDKAIAAYQHVIELEPDVDDGYLNIGAIYFQQGKYNECIPQFQKALEVQPSWLAYSNLGTAYFYLKRYNESVTMFEKAVGMARNEQLAVGNLADAYRWSGQKDKAQAAYDKAIGGALKDLAVNPRNTLAMGSIAVYCAKKGESTKALDFIHRARAIDTNDVNLIYNEAVVETLANRPGDAIKTLRLAFQKGYAPEDVLSDPELDALKSRPDFIALLKEFSKKSS